MHISVQPESAKLPVAGGYCMDCAVLQLLISDLLSALVLSLDCTLESPGEPKGTMPGSDTPEA